MNVTTKHEYMHCLTDTGYLLYVCMVYGIYKRFGDKPIHVMQLPSTIQVVYNSNNDMFWTFLDNLKSCLLSLLSV